MDEVTRWQAGAAILALIAIALVFLFQGSLHDAASFQQVKPLYESLLNNSVKVVANNAVCFIPGGVTYTTTATTTTLPSWCKSNISACNV